MRHCPILAALLATAATIAACAPASNGDAAATAATNTAQAEPRSADGRRFLSQPLVTDIYTADPSAHV